MLSRGCRSCRANLSRWCSTPRNGLVSKSDPRGESVVVTSERVVRDGVSEGARVVSMFPLQDLAAVEVSDSGRSFERLAQGITLAAVGLVLGGLSWFILEIQVLSVILGGLPILAGIYILTGWAFPDTEGGIAPLRTGPCHSPAAAVLHGQGGRLRGDASHLRTAMGGPGRTGRSRRRGSHLPAWLGRRRRRSPRRWRRSFPGSSKRPTKRPMKRRA